MCMMRKLMGRAEWKYKLSLLSCSECPGGHHARGMAGKSLLFRNNKSFIPGEMGPDYTPTFLIVLLQWLEYQSLREQGPWQAKSKFSPSGHCQHSQM